jgi:Ca2+-binding EF-hand superfamily protein
MLDEYREVFQLFDRDGSSSINPRELRHVLRTLGQNPTADQLKKVVDISTLLLTCHSHHCIIVI